MKTRLTMLTVAAALSTMAIPAAAQAPSPPAARAPDSEQKARALFKAGVEAYKQGQFLAAAQAFVQAHEILPKPQLLFSIAQAFRRSFDATQNQDHLVQAVKYYRQYLDEVPEGGRRLDATQALGDLRPWLTRLGVDADSATEMTFPTRISVRSPVQGAVVVVDGGEVHALPYSAQIEPGSHRIEVHARGYRSEARELIAEERETVPFDVPLEGIAPTLEVTDADGAEVIVDGQLLGEAPFSQPLPVARGRHYVTVLERGHEAYAAELDFDYGTKTALAVDLPATDQRRVAWGVLAAGGAGLVTSGVLFGIALVQESRAKEIGQRQAAGTITAQERDDFNTALSARDDFTLAGSVAAGVSGAVVVTGLFLYLFDEPEAPPPARTRPDRPDDASPSQDEPDDVEIMGAPALGPGLMGLAITGRF